MPAATDLHRIAMEEVSTSRRLRDDCNRLRERSQAILRETAALRVEARISLEELRRSLRPGRAQPS